MPIIKFKKLYPDRIYYFKILFFWGILDNKINMQKKLNMNMLQSCISFKQNHEILGDFAF